MKRPVENSSYSIRKARQTDVPEITKVIRQSIEKLCSEDHQKDPEKLSAWLSNKTENEIVKWITSPDNFSIVAVDSNQNVLGVGMIDNRGDILILYVSPQATKIGVGSALMKNLEKHARLLGLLQITVASTKTAAGFYRRHGYASNGGSDSYLLIKRLLI